MKLTAAIIYSEKEIFIEFSPEKFKQLLEKYYDETKDTNKAIDKIIVDIKKAAATARK